MAYHTRKNYLCDVMREVSPSTLLEMLTHFGIKKRGERSRNKIDNGEAKNFRNPPARPLLLSSNEEREIERKGECPFQKRLVKMWTKYTFSKGRLRRLPAAIKGG